MNPAIAVQIRARPLCVLALRNTASFRLGVFSSRLAKVGGFVKRIHPAFGRKVVPRALEPRTLRLSALRSN